MQSSANKRVLEMMSFINSRSSKGPVTSRFLQDSANECQAVCIQSLNGPSLGSAKKEWRGPLVSVPSNAIVVQLPKKAAVWDTVKCFRKAQDNHVCLNSIVLYGG